MANKKDGKKNLKKCASCSLNCVIARSIAVKKVEPSKHKDFLIQAFGEGEPVYTMTNCPKKGR